MHVRGVHNVSTNAISCWNWDSVLGDFRTVRPNTPLQVLDRGAIGMSLCTSVLPFGSCETPLKPRLPELFDGFFAHG